MSSKAAHQLFGRKMSEGCTIGSLARRRRYDNHPGKGDSLLSFFLIFSFVCLL